MYQVLFQYAIQQSLCINLLIFTLMRSSSSTKPKLYDIPENCYLRAIQKQVWQVHGQLTKHYQILALVRDNQGYDQMIRISYSKSGLCFNVVKQRITQTSNKKLKQTKNYGIHFNQRQAYKKIMNVVEHYSESEYQLLIKDCQTFYNDIKQALKQYMNKNDAKDIWSNEMRIKGNSIWDKILGIFWGD